MNKRLIGLTVLLLAVIGGAWFSNGRESSEQKTHPQKLSAPGIGVGERLPEFTLPSLSKKQVTVKSTGKVTVLNFFTTWCPPCRQEMPQIDMFAEKYKSTLDFYAVNIQQPPSTVAEFMDKNNYSFKDALLFDESGQVARSFRINAIPTTIVADKDGVIRHIKLGAVNLRQLEDLLEKLPAN